MTKELLNRIIVAVYNLRQAEKKEAYALGLEDHILDDAWGQSAPTSSIPIQTAKAEYSFLLDDLKRMIPE